MAIYNEFFTGGVKASSINNISSLNIIFSDGWELYNESNSTEVNFFNKWGNFSINRNLDLTTGRYFGTGVRLGSNSSNLPDYIFTPTFPNSSTWLVGFNFKKNTSGINGSFLKAYDGENIQLDFKTNNNNIEVYRGTNLIHTFFNAIDNDSWQHIQIKFHINTNGFVKLRSENSHIPPFGLNLNTQETGNQQVNRFMLTSSTQADDEVSWLFDDFWICSINETENRWLGNLKIEGLNIDGTGFRNDWVDSKSKKPGDITSYTVENPTNILGDIKAVSVESTTKKGGPCDSVTSEIFIKVNSDLKTSNEKTITNNLLNRNYDIFKFNPNDQNWTINNIEDIEIGVKAT